MSALEYLRTKAASLTFAVLGIVTACVIATVCGCPTDAVVLMAAVLASCVACACIVDHLRARRFYQNMRELANELEHPYQLHALMAEPTVSDQAVVYDALKAMGVASAAEVARAEAKAVEHREFVEGWVHGVKAPLAACKLITERVAEPEQSQLASELDAIGHKVDSALWYARSDCANGDYAIREVTLADIVREACRENARFLIEQNCFPSIDIDDSLVVFTDKKQASFIISQLVENAAKYGARNLWFSAECSMSHDTGPGKQGNAEHGMPRGKTGNIALHVEDDGRGIPTADVSRVFERGFTGTRGREGTASTGMGLYLAARLCEQLGLGLSISSIDGEGTCATVTFPLDRRRDIETATITEPPSAMLSNVTKT